MRHKINHANIKEWAANYEGELFDGILCDPPYELGFMGKSWDSSGIAFDTEMWADLFKLIKPGGHLLAFSGSRTYHRMAVAIEDAGFEIRDMIEWVYGSGFPKSLNIGKAVDKIQGNEREVTGEAKHGMTGMDNFNYVQGKRATDYNDHPETYNTTKGTSPYEGYGTALKPAHEPCVLARKPIEGTVANNVLKHGTGGLAIDKCRIPSNTMTGKLPYDIIEVCQENSTTLPAQTAVKNQPADKHQYNNIAQESVATQDSENQIGKQQGDTYKTDMSCSDVTSMENTSTSSSISGYGKQSTDKTSQKDTKYTTSTKSEQTTDPKTLSCSVSQTTLATTNLNTEQEKIDSKQVVSQPESIVNAGRWPSNLIHDGSDEVEAVFPQTKSGKIEPHHRKSNVYGGNSLLSSKTINNSIASFGDSGSASRFFYTAKASKSERNAGLEGFEEVVKPLMGEFKDNPGRSTPKSSPTARANHHPTVKPLSLTKYLATLIKPPTGGRLLVPFSGSGSEMIGALQAGWEYVEGVELTEEYIPIAEARIAYWIKQPNQEKLL